MSDKPNILLIGHLCHDVVPGGFKVGGAVAYGAVVARQMGCKVHILTSYGPDFQFAAMFSFAGIEVVPSSATTCFQNIYTGNRRLQFLRGRAADLKPRHLPATWPAPDVVVLAPIADEVAFSFTDCFENALLAVCPQGWYRQWDASGRVFPKEVSLESWPEKADVISLSDEDLAGKEQVEAALRLQTKRLVITQGEHGAKLIMKGRSEHFPAKDARLVDSTGAGDVFATAFVIRLWQCGDEKKAMDFALSAAAKSVECADLKDLRIC